MKTQRFILLLISLVVSVVCASNAESTEFLKVNAMKQDVITLPSGLQYKVLQKGTGSHHPTVNSPTLCHYEGRLIDGTIFDSSYQRGSPITFAPNQVIKGWTEIMQIMVEGDKFEMYIPSELGYGESGSPPKIKPGDALIFIMEMIEIKGEKVKALRCNVLSFDGCDDKEKDYVKKAYDKYQTAEELQKEMERITKISSGHLSGSAKDWAAARLNILEKIAALKNDSEL
jgi:FKBP-type peptidyl-prolyl cis-trans isomerase FklB